ncbi:MAG: cation diffusion facilitator family transporter [Thermoanaerobaculia bacterium]
MHDHRFPHSHAQAQAAREGESPLRALRIALVVTATLLVVQVVGGILSSSLALLADAAHMLADLGGLGLSYAAVRLTQRPATPTKSYGFHRAEVLAAVLNGTVLLCLSVFILIEAYGRLRSPEPVRPLFMGIAAFIGLAGNLISLSALRGPAQGGLNLRAAYLEVLADTLGTLGVLVASAVIYLTGFLAIDPILSVLLALAIVPRTIRLVGEGLHVLFEGTPRGLDHALIEGTILAVPGVAAVHDLHVWALASGIPVLTAHVVVEGGAGCDDLLDRVAARLKDEFSIDHTTIQIEHADRADREEVRF